MTEHEPDDDTETLLRAILAFFERMAPERRDELERALRRGALHTFGTSDRELARLVAAYNARVG